MLNKTHAEHSIIAVAIQLALWPLVGLMAGGIAACCIFLGREIAQHEYALIRKRGSRSKIRWYEGVTTGWSTDSIIDFVAPVVACSAALLAGYFLI